MTLPELQGRSRRAAAALESFADGTGRGPLTDLVLPMLAAELRHVAFWLDLAAAGKLAERAA